MATDNYCYPGNGEGTRGGKRGRPQDGCQGSGPCATFVLMAELSYGEEQPSNNRAGRPLHPAAAQFLLSPSSLTSIRPVLGRGCECVVCSVLFVFFWLVAHSSQRDIGRQAIRSTLLDGSHQKEASPPSHMRFPGSALALGEQWVVVGNTAF